MNNPEKIKTNKCVIDEHLFVESFVLIANGLNFKDSGAQNEISIYQKLVYLVELINES